jgi:hypothetical protein
LENKYSHIDDFFEKQLSQLEGSADKKAMEAIFKHVDHTEHPIDFALNKGLSDFAEEPGTLSVSDSLGSDLPIIDLALYRQLKAYEATPDKAFNFEPVRKKRRFVWMFFFLVSAVAIGTFTWMNQNTDLTTKDISDNTTSQNQINKKPYTRFDGDEKPQLNISDKVRTKNRNKWSANAKLPDEINLIKEIEETNLMEDYASEKHLSLQDLVPFKSQLNIDAILKVPLKTRPYGPVYKALPFSFIIQTGAISEIGQSNRLLSDNQHKDAEKLFTESSGSYRAGKNYSFSIDYNFSKRLKIQTGVVYSASSNISALDYYYTDLPVYDTTGALRGYLKRPASSSNHTEAKVKNNSNSIAIPISVQYNIIQLRKLGVWLGAGLQLAMQRQVKGQYFDFKTEQMLSSNQTFARGILPQMSIGFRYPLTDRWQLTSQFQMARQALTFHIQESSFRRVEFLPSLNFGLVFTPYIRIK